jgi:glycosyltransferase involved in cell wall biosynthesis
VKILWHGNPPDAYSGYGVQAALFGPRIAALGHEVAYSANTRVNLPATTWQGHKVYSAGIMELGADSLAGHYQDFGADLLVMLCDAWQFDPVTVQGMNVVTWLPVDCDPLGAGDKAFLYGSDARPIAMSGHGQLMLNQAGFDPPVIPHGVDTAVFRPLDRAAARAKLGLDGKTFTVGVNAQNVERKAIVQSLIGFAAFHRAHPDSVLFLHSTTTRGEPGSTYLPPVIASLGLPPGAVRFENHYDIVTCRIGGLEMAQWYNALDVLLAASMGEGFGVPIVEAMACGTPVIGTRCSTMPELIPDYAGWLVDGTRVWKDRHQAWWVLPSPKHITWALGRALASSVKDTRRRERAAQWGATFDADRIAADCWGPLLKEMEAGL